MIQRQPYLPRFMAGGPGNPLGARALYLGNTVYRLHGTNQPQTIGQAVSSGLLSAGQWRCHRSFRSRARRHEGRRPPAASVVSCKGLATNYGVLFRIAVSSTRTGYLSRCCACSRGCDGLRLSGHAQTLKAVKDRGTLNCGVSEGLPGFSTPDRQGQLVAGLDVDFCRAVAAAIFNDKQGQIHPLGGPGSLRRIAVGAIDVLSRNSTWTMSRETELKLVFAGVTYFDGQGFMVRRAMNANSALDLGGKKICVQVGTTTELNLADFFKTNNMQYDLASVSRADDAVKAYETGQCDVFTADVSGLYAERAKALEAGRPRHPGGHHLQGAAGAGGAPGRRAMVQYREMDQFRDDQCRRTWDQLE